MPRPAASSSAVAEGAGASPAPSYLSVRGITKTYGNTVALRSVDFDVAAGEVHALLGENGAGKSTLVKILSGSIQPDRGSIAIAGERVELHSPSAALKLGISVVHQELSLLPNLTVSENVNLGDVPLYPGLGRFLGMVNRREMRRRARAITNRLGLDSGDVLVSSLTPAECQLVEISRALAHSARYILLDEPTSSLPPDERQGLFRRIEELRRLGIGVIFITHLLQEALDVSDRVTVLRDGNRVGSRNSTETSVEELIEMMTGRPAGAVFPSRDASATVEEGYRLRVEHLASPPRVRDVSFAVRRGEVVGLAGLVGAGRTESLEAIFGVRRRDGGSVWVGEAELRAGSPLSAIERGLALIPEDRQAHGLFPDETVARNLCLIAANSGRGDEVTRARGLLDGHLVGRVARRWVQDLAIKTSSLDTAVSALSGGNQQKVIIGRCLATDPAVVLADDPTRGVAIGSKIEIYRLFRALAARGAAVVIASSEFEELVGLCDRIIVLTEGRTTGEVTAGDVDADRLLNYVLSLSNRRRSSGAASE